MSISKRQELSDFVSDVRADSEAFTQDKDVATSFDEDVRKQNAEQRERLLGEEQPEMDEPPIQAGDLEVDARYASTVGEEAPGGGNPTPDQDIVEDIGRAVGLTYEDNEPLQVDDKLRKRDQDRWELNPASAEDFHDRHLGH